MRPLFGRLFIFTLIYTRSCPPKRIHQYPRRTVYLFPVFQIDHEEMDNEPRSVRHLIFRYAQQFDVECFLRSIGRIVVALKHYRMPKRCQVVGIGDGEMAVHTTVIEPTLIYQKPIVRWLGHTLIGPPHSGGYLYGISEPLVPLEAFRFDMNPDLPRWVPPLP